MGRAGTVIIASERTCMMGCRCTPTNRSGPPGLGPAVYLTWVLLLAGLALAPPSIALAQASRADDELAEARRLNQEAATLYSSGKLAARSEEHTSELQSRGHLVCRLLLEKKK